MKKVLYIFGQLSDTDVDCLINNGELETIPANQILIRKGKSVQYLYIVLDGRFAIMAGKNDDKKIAELSSGEIIGEMSFIDSAPPVVTVISEMKSEVYAISRRKLDDRIKDDQGFGFRLMKSISLFLADRLRSTTSLFGYGDINKLEEDDVISMDELDSMVFDNVSIAGERFSRMLSKMQHK